MESAKYLRLPPMPRARTKFSAIGPGGQGLLGAIFVHDGEYIQCVCDNWPFPQFAFSRRYADTPGKNHPAADWLLVNAPSQTDGPSVNDAFAGKDVLMLPIQEK